MRTFLHFLKWVVICGWGGSLLMFILLAFFNHPSLDDFSYAVLARNTGILQSQLTWYSEWSGRYVSTFFLSISPLYFHSLIAYKVATAFLLVVFFAAFSVAAYRCNIQSKSKLDGLFIASGFCVLYCLILPTFSEGFYWFASAVTYQWAFVVLLGFLYFAIRLQRGDTKSNSGQILTAIAGALLLALVAGFNELILIATGCICFFLLIFYTIKKRKIPWINALWLMVVVFCACVVYYSPGNALRSELMGTALSLGELIVNAGRSAGAFLTRTIIPILAFSLLITIPLWISREQKSETRPPIFFVNPWISILLTLMLTYIIFLAGWYSTHAHLPARSENVVLLLFLAGWFWTLDNGIYVLKRNAVNIPRKYLILLLIPALAGTFWFLLRENNIRSAMGDLLLQRAAKYNHEMNARDAYLLEHPSDTILIQEIQNRPVLLFIGSISDPAFPSQYQAYCKYYNKKHITFFLANPPVNNKLH